MRATKFVSIVFIWMGGSSRLTITAYAVEWSHGERGESIWMFHQVGSGVPSFGNERVWFGIDLLLCDTGQH